MLNRLGLVIHWLGFIGSTVLVVLFAYELSEFGMERAKWEIVISYTCGPILSGWLIRFVTAGHKNPLPWVANKETEQ